MSNNKIWQLVARKLSGEASLDELKELESLLQENPELAYRVDIYCQYFDKPSKSIYRTREAKEGSLEHFRARFNREFGAESKIVPLNTVHRRFFTGTLKKRIAVAAAAIVIASTIFFMIGRRVEIVTASTILFRTGRQTGNKPAAHPDAVREVNAMRGTRSQMILPDGSIVWLNSDSRISYNADFGQTRREITLIGEAFFDVAHNESVPMVVHTKNINILVKGTAFNVRSYPESNTVETSLIRGAVELTTNANPNRKIMLKPNEKIIVDVLAEDAASAADPVKIKTEKNPPEPADLYHIEQLDGSRYNIIPEISWMQNELVFDNEIFSEVIAKMEKWYNVKIVLENNELANKRVSGIFKKEDIRQALEALQYIGGFRFEINENTIVIR